MGDCLLYTAYYLQGLWQTIIILTSPNINCKCKQSLTDGLCNQTLKTDQLRMKGEKGGGGGCVCVKEIWLGEQHVRSSHFIFIPKFLFVFTFFGSILNFFFPMDICLFFGLFLLKMKKKNKSKFFRTISNYSDPFYHLGPKNVSWLLLWGIYITVILMD